MNKNYFPGNNFYYEEENMKLIVGLGNPGKEYIDTRHNIGFDILDNYLTGIKWSENKYGLFYKNKDIIFLKPITYMNLSGIAVKYFVDYYKIDLKNILIIHDDLDLNLADYRLKKESSSGGHNGVQSIIENLQSNNFLRLKIGISHSQQTAAASYVLSKLSREEKKCISDNLNTFNNIITDFINNKSAQELMNKYN
jgi:PTH1 family peptidyl-tRNA hydrolase